jgi:cytochrome b involved in lipid metabolism
MDEVKAHNTPDKCWTTIRSKVYDLTAWIAKHPGGDKAIMQLCGIDGTSKFVNKHGGMPQMEKALTGLEIGTLKK